MNLSQNSTAEYYLDPFVQLAHTHLGLAKYAARPEDLCMSLGISKAHLAQILDLLVRIGYVKFEKGEYKVLARNRHLSKEDPLCGPHQALMRLKSIDQMQRLDRNESYTFSATITGGEETQALLQEAFFGFLKKAESTVKAAPSEKILQMNFDLFPWKI